MSTDRYLKDPSAVLRYIWDWGAEWLDVGETITSATVTVPAGLTKDSQSNTATTVTVWLSGGTVSTTWHKVVCHITTSLGQQEDRTLFVRVADR